MAISDLSMNICQMTNSLLVNFINASPRDSASTVNTITATANGMLSDDVKRSCGLKTGGFYISSPGS